MESAGDRDSQYFRLHVIGTYVCYVARWNSRILGVGKPLKLNALSPLAA